MDKYKLKNCRVIKVKLLGATNTKGHRLMIWEDNPVPDVRKDMRIFSWDWGEQSNDACQQALNILVKNGFKPFCRGTEPESVTIMCDDYGSDFKRIKDLKQ